MKALNKMYRRKITAINHYDVFPFNSGGSLAVRGLENGLSKWFDINLITFVTGDIYPSHIKISDHVTVYPVLVPEELVDQQNEFYKEYGMGKDTIYDSSILVMRLFHENTYIIKRIREIGANSDLLIAEHVYTWRIIKTAFPKKPALYRAHNVEYDFKLSAYKLIGSPGNLLKETYDFERKCCEESDHILTVSQLETDRFMELYRFPESMRSKFSDIHLGYDLNKNTVVFPSHREKMGGNYEYYGFFISSDIQSAVDAAKICIDTARKYPDIKIIIAGRIWRLLQDETNLPENVEITGVIRDEEKIRYLTHCDFAMNPVDDGAGVNVKMFEYFAYGIPVIATPYGARGTGMINGIEGMIVEKEQYSQAVRDFCDIAIEKKDSLARNAFALLEREYSWVSIAEKVAAIIGHTLSIDYKESEVSENETDMYSFIPDKAYLPRGDFYIRCAGNNGIKCLNYLRTKGLEPVAFVETDLSKIGTHIEGVPVISLTDFFALKDKTEIIVAVWAWMKVTSELLSKGISEEYVSVSWGDTGYDIFHISDMKGSIPPYYDRLKFHNDIMSKSKTTEK